MTTKLSFLLVLAFFGPALAISGLDVNDPISVSEFECLKKDGFQFVIPRLFHSSGTIDEVGIQNVQHAKTAGFGEVDGYIFPCLRSNCPSATEQVRVTLNRLAAVKTSINTLWLDIERYAWPESHASNRAFLEAMVKEANAMKQKVGIYTNKNNWEAIVGLDYKAQSNLLLWWAEYDGYEDFRRYVSFGGWTKPYIHQYHDTQTGPCGVSMDRNWKQ